jgi:isocitrate/isopropylmalate dehydrogenase
MPDRATAIEQAVDAVLERGLRTPDLEHGTVAGRAEVTSQREVGTEEMTAAVIEALGS